METVFGTAFEYKLIYVFAINDEAHKGLLKIGDTTIQSDTSIDALFPLHQRVVFHDHFGSPIFDFAP